MKIVDRAIYRYSDVGVSVLQCIEWYFEDIGKSDFLAEYYYNRWLDIQSLEAGVPQSVIDGNERLRDVFSPEYIKYKCNK